MLNTVYNIRPNENCEKKGIKDRFCFQQIGEKGNLRHDWLNEGFDQLFNSVSAEPK